MAYGNRSQGDVAVTAQTQILAAEIEIIKFWQYEFFRQWRSLRAYAHEHGIQIIGDIPIYVAHDSSDVWTDRDFFCLDERGNALQVAGVPPDYFSATGQLWGNPIYNWPLLAKTGFRWWIDRFRSSLRLYDIMRIDHFRGFEAYWEVPGTETTAINGKWVKGPGAALFAVLEAELGQLPVIAENLGRITPRWRRSEIISVSRGWRSWNSASVLTSRLTPSVRTISCANWWPTRDP